MKKQQPKQQHQNDKKKLRCISVDAIPWLLNINWKVCERVFTLTFDDFVYFCCYWASWHAITFVFGCIFVVIHNIKLTGDKSYGVFFHCSRFRSHLFFHVIMFVLVDCYELNQGLDLHHLILLPFLSFSFATWHFKRLHFVAHCVYWSSTCVNSLLISWYFFWFHRLHKPQAFEKPSRWKTLFFRIAKENMISRSYNWNDSPFAGLVHIFFEIYEKWSAKKLDGLKGLRKQISEQYLINESIVEWITIHWLFSNIAYEHILKW